MSVNIHEVKGYDQYQKKMDDLCTTNEPIYCWYMGARSENGQSWCGDCRDSEPLIKEYLNSLELKENINVVCAEVEREDFRAPDCGFRKDEGISLSKVPTLFCPTLKKKLVERDCMDRSKLSLFFADVKKA